MKILIIGASGQVGGALLALLSNEFDIAGTFSKNHKNNLIHLDITSKEEIDKLLKNKYQVVILASALTNVDYCETNELEARKINVEGAKNIVESCKKYKSKLVYVSTDYIFDGRGGPYSEESVPNPINVYGKTKLEAENLVKTLNDFIIIRATNIFDWGFDEKNFVYRAITTLKKGVTIKTPIDQYATPCLSSNLAEFVKEMLLNNKKGVYNIASKDLLSRHEFALKIADYFNLDKSLIIPVTTEELKQTANRPRKGGLKVDKIEKEFKTQVLSLNDCLNNIKERM